jgi:TolA-binding protein
MRLGADERATIALGGHRIDLEAGAAMKLALVSKAAVVVELVRGAAVFDVDFQTENGLFSVQVEDAVVSVKGTRFRVRTDDGIVSIAVSEGLVGIVRQGREVARLAAGEKIEFDIGNSMFVVPGSTESAPPSPSMIDSDPGDADSGSSYTVPPAIDRGEGAEAASAKSMGAGVRASREAEGARQADTVDRGAGTEATTLAALKNLAVDGRLQEALEGLEEYVVLHPADAEAWFLVGECRRKLGDHTGAVDAYGRVVATGSDDKADIARLKAGIVLQDKLGRHGEAVGFFETMLNEKSDASPLRAEVLLRCARSLLALGRDAEARLRLQEIVSEYGANPAAVEAREILRGLE